MKTIFHVDMNRIHHNSGFTLIEIMIVVVIIGLLAAIAYPNYTVYVERGKRAEGRALLLEYANRMERFYSNCNKYPKRGSPGGSTTACNAAVTRIMVPPWTPDSLYRLLVQALPPNDQNFRLRAVPRNWTDDDCGALELRNDGTRGCVLCGSDPAKIEKCWGK